METIIPLPSSKKENWFDRLMKSFSRERELDEQWTELKENLNKQSLVLMKMATDCEKRALDYDTSDPYLAGSNAGRAIVYHTWSEWMSTIAKAIK